MSKGMLFWLLMVLWFVYGIWIMWPRTQPPPAAYSLVDSLLLFVLMFLLGWATFGFVVQ